MHRSSLMKVEAFLAVYANGNVTGKRVLDVGSAMYGSPDGRSYRPVCERIGLKYVGLDMLPGLNVDIATARPCC